MSDRISSRIENRQRRQKAPRLLKVGGVPIESFGAFVAGSETSGLAIGEGVGLFNLITVWGVGVGKFGPRTP